MIPQRTLPTLDEYFARWQVLHNAADVDPRDNVALRLFLSVVYRVARPFAKAGVSPNVVTILGLAQGLVGLGLAGAVPIAASVVILASSVTDGVDGCVAALTDRSTRFGALFDSIADRLTEWCFVAAAVVTGANPWLGVGAAAAIVLFEYTRARLLASGLQEVGPVTVGERPTRVIACVIAVGADAFTEAHLVANVAMAVVVVTSFIAMVQLLRWAIPRLS